MESPNLQLCFPTLRPFATTSTMTWVDILGRCALVINGCLFVFAGTAYLQGVSSNRWLVLDSLFHPDLANSCSGSPVPSNPAQGIRLDELASPNEFCWLGLIPFYSVLCTCCRDEEPERVLRALPQEASNNFLVCTVGCHGNDGPPASSLTAMQSPLTRHSHVTHTSSTVWLLLSRHDTTTPLSFFSPSEPPAAFAALLLPFVATFVAHSLRTGLPWYPRRSFLRFIRSVHCAPHHGTRPRRPGQSSLGKEVVLEYELACTTLPSVQWRMCCMYVLLYECAVCMCCLYVLCGPS